LWPRGGAGSRYLRAQRLDVLAKAGQLSLDVLIVLMAARDSGRGDRDEREHETHLGSPLR
jgi:hypothetical protein